MSLFLGLDFGTESVRAVVVDRGGVVRGSGEGRYAHGQMVGACESVMRVFGRALPGQWALQHPGDWIDAAGDAVRAAARIAGRADIAGIGVDFTSCTMLPCRLNGSPLCLDPGAPVVGRAIAEQPLSRLAVRPHSWPKLWKHHGAHDQAERITRMARARGEVWLDRYGGSVGLEWLFPKMLEVIEEDAEAASAAEVWLEGGDWLVWQLIGSPWLAGGEGTSVSELPRSTCQAGYKALWSREGGYPSREFLSAVHPGLAEAAQRRMPGRHVAPGVGVGELCEAMGARLGVRAGVPVSAAIIDAHAGVPGAGVAAPGEMVLVMGTSGCHMLLSEHEARIPGVAGIVKDGIVPGYYGIETGQAAMGDAFEFVRRLTGARGFEELEAAAAAVAPGAEGVVCVDWFNGCRTPLMDGSLRGAFVGLTLHHDAAHLYRAALEGSAFGLRWIVETLRGAGVRVERFVATGGLPSRSPLFMKIVASVLESPVAIADVERGPALGAAILGALAAGRAGGGFEDIGEAVGAMGGGHRVVESMGEWVGVYDDAYAKYREAAESMRDRG